MKTKYRYLNYTIAITFVWVGFVSAISFMEAWLKFQAPGITTELGLGIGQLVFNGLNKVEITFAIVIGVILIFSRPSRKEFLGLSFFLIPLIILSIQTLWLLPALDHRAEVLISGIDLPNSKLHLWYVLLEIVKVVSLFIYGTQLFGIWKLRKSSKKKS